MDEDPELAALPAELLQVTVERAAPDVVVLRVIGDIDLLTAEILHDSLSSALVAENRAVVLDLTRVGFLGSAGLAELAEANDVARRTGLRLVLVATEPVVLRPLEVTGLRTLFELAGSVECALGGG